MTCKFCEEVERRMITLADLIATWSRRRTVHPEHAEEIDRYYREQYRNMSNADHHSNPT